jgi:hypothetical protein
LESVEARLRNDDALADVEKDIAALEAYVDSSEALRGRVHELRAMTESYEERWVERPLHVARQEIPALEIASSVLARPFDSPDPDIVEESELKRAEKAVDAAIEIVGTGRLAFVRIGRLIDRLAAAAVEAEELGEDKAPFETAGADLERLAASVLRAADTETIDAAYSKALEKLPAELPEALEIQEDVQEEFATPPAAAVGDRIEFQVHAPPGVDPRTAGNVDDRFGYRLVLADPPDGVLEVTWAVGGTAVKSQQIRDSRESAWWYHRFDEPGEYVLTVQSGGDPPLATHQQVVTGPSRLDAERRAFGERERRFTWIAFALSLASGMLSLYLADPAWGTNEDYVKALLWGAVVSEGVALVGAVIANQFPAGK